MLFKLYKPKRAIRAFAQRFRFAELSRSHAGKIKRVCSAQFACGGIDIHIGIRERHHFAIARHYGMHAFAQLHRARCCAALRGLVNAI